MCRVNHRIERVIEEREGAYLAGNDEGNSFDSRSSNFVCTCNFTVRDIEGSSRKEAHSTLRVRRLVLRQREQVVVLPFEVSNVAITMRVEY